MTRMDAAGDRHRHWRLVTVLVALAGVAGCCPANFTLVPQIRGRVVDAAGQPVPDARVHVAKPHEAEGFELDTTLTCDVDGRFYRKEHTRWGVFIVPMDLFATHIEAVADHNGRQSDVQRYRGPAQVRLFGGGSPQVVEFGDLMVK
jgi:hypothetical protein